MDNRSLHDGREDGLEPLESLSLDGIASFRDLLRDVQNGILRPPTR